MAKQRRDTRLRRFLFLRCALLLIIISGASESSGIEAAMVLPSSSSYEPVIVPDEARNADMKVNQDERYDLKRAGCPFFSLYFRAVLAGVCVPSHVRRSLCGSHDHQGRNIGTNKEFSKAYS